jgi:hypothetical protein
LIFASLYQDKEDRKKLIQMREKLIKILSSNYLISAIASEARQPHLLVLLSLLRLSLLAMK